MMMRTKSAVIVALLLLTTGALVFAQNTESPWGQKVTVAGTLQLQNGQVVLVSGDTSYFVPLVLRYVGFIDGLKEGAQVSVEGYVGGYNRLMPIAFTVNGKSYDLAGFGNPGGYCGGGYGAGYCGDWDDDDRYRHSGRGRGRHGGRW